LAKEMSGPVSNIVILASDDNRRTFAAAVAPDATPPTIIIFSIFMFIALIVCLLLNFAQKYKENRNMYICSYVI
jgi:hypothetical protein